MQIKVLDNTKLEKFYTHELIRPWFQCFVIGTEVWSHIASVMEVNHEWTGRRLIPNKCLVTEIESQFELFTRFRSVFGHWQYTEAEHWKSWGCRSTKYLLKVKLDKSSLSIMAKVQISNSFRCYFQPWWEASNSKRLSICKWYMRLRGGTSTRHYLLFTNFDSIQLCHLRRIRELLSTSFKSLSLLGNFLVVRKIPDVLLHDCSNNQVINFCINRHIYSADI